MIHKCVCACERVCVCVCERECECVCDNKERKKLCLNTPFVLSMRTGTFCSVLRMCVDVPWCTRLSVVQT